MGHGSATHITAEGPRLFLVAALLGLALSCSGGDKSIGPTEEGDDTSLSGNTSALSVGPYAGNRAPDFTLTSIDTTQVTLKSLAGKPVFLNFWATWCGPCVSEMPDIETLKKELGDKIQIVGIDLRESTATVSSFVRSKGYTWTFVTDPNGAVGTLYKVDAIPTSIFIDAAGAVTGRQVGSMSLATMRTLANTAIASN